MHLPNTVLGDEQVFDVELDRNTVFLPVQEDQRIVSWERPYDPRFPGSLSGLGSSFGAVDTTTRHEQTSDEPHDRGVDTKEGDDASDQLTKGQCGSFFSVFAIFRPLLADSEFTFPCLLDVPIMEVTAGFIGCSFPFLGLGVPSVRTQLNP